MSETPILTSGLSTSELDVLATLDEHFMCASVIMNGEARRVDTRIREVLLHIDQGRSLDAPKRGPTTYHPGRPPAHKVWRASRGAKAAAKAAAAAAREASEADAA